MNPWKELGIFKAGTSKDPNEKTAGALMFLNEEDDEELEENINDELDESEDEEDKDEDYDFYTEIYKN